jgi:hypothetical protein
MEYFWTVLSTCVWNLKLVGIDPIQQNMEKWVGRLFIGKFKQKDKALSVVCIVTLNSNAFPSPLFFTVVYSHELELP